MKLNILHLKNYPIYKQLQIEESLLRTNEENWCILNEGSPPSIVMGISGKAEFLIDLKKAERQEIPIIKRYSGGGTVIVDDKTLFISFIFQKNAHAFPAFPEHIMRWSEKFYSSAFDLEGFQLRENDYTIGNLKCGGNAQYIRKNRWVHHTTFLWDYRQEQMNLLLQPKKAPQYRNNRNHDEFLTKLKKHFSSKRVLVEKIKKQLQRDFSTEEVLLDQLPLQRDHRKTTQYLYNYV